MDLMKLMRSVEEFVFEAITLLYFYPRTLLRIVCKPLQRMRYAEVEEASGFAMHVPQPQEASAMAKTLLNSPENLLIFRSLLLSLIPLTAAVLALRRRKLATSRTALRQPFAGTALYLVRRLTGSIWPAMVVHALWDFCSLAHGLAPAGAAKDSIVLLGGVYGVSLTLVFFVLRRQP